MRSHFKSIVGTFVAGALHGCMSSVNISAPFRASLPRAILRRRASPSSSKGAWREPSCGPAVSRVAQGGAPPLAVEPPREACLRPPSSCPGSRASARRRGPPGVEDPRCPHVHATALVDGGSCGGDVESSLRYCSLWSGCSGKVRSVRT